MTFGLIGHHIDLLHIHREQHIYPDLVKAAKALNKKWKPKLILVEAAMSGTSLYQDLIRARIRGTRYVKPRGDKVQRMSAQTAKLEAGQMRLPENAPWLECFLAEVAAFPNSKFDDQVDCMSQLLKLLDGRISQLGSLSRYKS